ncbi:MAG TPA: ribose 5-phosphate isomerase B [Clostridia bacterium]
MIALGNDHAAFNLKKTVIEFLKDHNLDYKDFGAFESDDTEGVDYPDYALKVAKAVASGECEKGILLCGTGIGVSIAANKVRGIRAAVCTDVFSAKAARQHNNANILCLGERVIGPGVAREILEAFFATDFEGGRHQRRLDKISDIEKNPHLK